MIGEKIRNIRKSKELTIIELADQVNVTPGYISQIERDLIDPSLSVLRRLSKVLSTPLATLFSEEASTGVVVIPVDKRTKIKFGDINMEYEYLTPSAKNNGKSPNMEVIYFKLSPNSWGSNEIMVHEADECVYVLEGTLEYHVGEIVYTIEQGGSIYVPENHRHLLYNPGDCEVVAIGIISPPAY